jgi:uncharacterized integral membrane protein
MDRDRGGLQSGSVKQAQTLTAGMRRLLLIASALVVVLGTQLFVLTEATDRYFAWTIEVPLSAAFLGAAYWGGLVLLVMAARERLWARVRVAVPAVLALTISMFVVTLLHLDLFHLDESAGGAARAAAYGWIVAYGLVPASLLAFSIRQLKVPGGDPPRIHRLPAWLRVVLCVQAALLIGLASALLLVPDRVSSVWPWELTPLTGRAIGAWFLGIGVAAGHWAWENAWERVLAVVLSYGVLAALEIVALARYPDAVDWATPQSWVYTAFLTSMLLVAGYGMMVIRRNVAEVRTSAD